MPYASYLAIRKMIAKRRGRVGSMSRYFGLPIFIVLAALIVWMGVHFSQPSSGNSIQGGTGRHIQPVALER